MKIKLISFAAILLLQGCLASAPTAPDPNDKRACIINFEQSGEFMKGRKYKTFTIVSGVSKANAVDALTAHLASDGLQIISANKDLGLVSAQQSVSSTAAKTVPINAIVKSTGSGSINIEMNLSLSGGLDVSDASVRKSFCDSIESVQVLSKSSASMPSQPAVSTVKVDTKPVVKTKDQNRAKANN